MKALLLTVCVAVGLLASTAQASKSGRRNTILGLGALTIYELATGKTTNGVIAGIGTYYAYERYKDAHNKSRRRRVQHRYITVAPPGWHHGQKTGWHGYHVPPSQRWDHGDHGSGHWGNEGGH
jgi:hypothetical protein